MHDDTILEISPDGRYRVRIIQDTDPVQLEDESGWPILRYGYDRARGNGTAEQIKGIGPDVPGEILTALRIWWDETDKVERYLRMFHGTTSVVYIETRDESFMVFDTAAVRESYGLTDEYMAAHPEHFAGKELVRGTADEWRAYCEGDVYGYVLEENVTWTTDADFEDRESWETVDSCWGFYGSEYVQVEARGALASVVGS